MNWSGKRVLVTGAGGFIGSHLTEALVRSGAMVRGFFHYGVSEDKGALKHAGPAILDSVEPIFGDLRDAEVVQTAVESTDFVFHLAALVGIPYSYRAPRDVVETNVVGTLNILQAARMSKTSRLIHTSTSEVYGSAKTVPMTEEHPLQAQSPYAASKIGADQMVLAFHRSFEVPASVVRPFNTYGPRQSMRAIIPTIVGQALTSDRVRLGSTTPTRDFTFVSDTVSGFLAVAQCDDALGQVYNVGTGRESSVGEAVRIVGSLLNRQLEVDTDEQRVRPPSSEVDRLLADTSKIRKDCNWTPKIALEQGLAHVIDWVEDNRDGYDATHYGI
jgi:NAD dependent epimerase/dehydratase